MPIKILSSILWAYRSFLSPLFGECCRYYPTCSQYFIDSVFSRGMWRGSLSGIWRIARCNPFSLGGYDPAK